jgi:hypothetical protein
MQTLDLVVTKSRTDAEWRGSRERTRLVIASLAALALGAVAWLERPPAVSGDAAPSKLDARIAVAPVWTPSVDDERLAAFQQSVALSFVNSAPVVAAAANAHSDAAASKSALRRDRIVAAAGKRQEPPATPLPPARPLTPLVIEADLPSTPAAPAADPGYVDASLQALGDVGRRVALVPDQARDLAAAAVDRLGGTLSDVRAKIGL